MKLKGCKQYIMYTLLLSAELLITGRNFRLVRAFLTSSLKFKPNFGLKSYFFSILANYFSKHSHPIIYS